MSNRVHTFCSRQPKAGNGSGFLAFFLFCSIWNLSCSEYGYQLLPNTTRSLLGGTTAVSVRTAWLLTSRVYVHATVIDEGRLPLSIDCREWALRGPDGSTYPSRPDGPCFSQPATLLAPGQSLELALEFPITGHDALDWSSVELVVGGVREMPDGAVQVLGTVPFVRSGARERFEDQKNAH